MDYAVHLYMSNNSNKAFSLKMANSVDPDET